MDLDLSKKLLPFVKGGTFVWTMTTNGYKFYTLNLLRWLQTKAGVPWPFCIICCDTESYQFFKREGIACVPYRVQETKGQLRIAGFGSTDFAKWNRIKLDLLRLVAREAAAIGCKRSLYLDGDIVVQKDPIPVLEEIANQTGCRLLFQCDCAHTQAHEPESDGCQSICSGMIWADHEALGTGLADLYSFDSELWTSCERQDQPYIARRLVATEQPFRTVSRRLFGNGHWQKSLQWQRTNEADAGNDWILLHYNYRVGDTKKAAMKTYGHWIIPY